MRTAHVLLLIAGLGLTACEGNPAGPETATDELTVDASANWAFVRLFGADPQPVSVTAAETSSQWDIGFLGTSVMLNGGAAGPGGVLGYCVCGNESATDNQVMSFNATSQQAAFDVVTLADAPAADSLWRSDVLSPAITGWYSYNFATHAVSAARDKSFYVRTADGNAFAKLRVTDLQNATQTTPGRVTFEYALQTAKGAAMGAVRTASIDVTANGRAYFDLNAGVAGESGWDIAFQGYSIRVNGGVSGSGQAGAVAVTTPFAEITDASAPPATVYRADAYGGVFDAKKWYRYNLTGNDHQIWPTFNVYLIKRGSAIYKVQLVNYYGAAGETRHITLRAQRLTD